jgi:hypothetical protein
LRKECYTGKPMVTGELTVLSDIVDIEEGLIVALQGKPHRDIAKAMGLSERAYYKLRSQHDLFRQAVDRARFEGHEAIADSVLTIVDDNPDLGPQSIKIKLDAITTWLKWMINITPVDPLS